MALLNLRDISFSVGGQFLLNQAYLQVEMGERICLIGRNGSGKSTLMRLLHKEITPDQGQVLAASHFRTALLPQEVPQNLKGSVFQIVTEGQGRWSQKINEYQDLSARLAQKENPSQLKQLEQVQQELDALGGWERYQKVSEILSLLRVNPESEISELSGGVKRRVLLAKALVYEPDLLLLDEPTNHLDLQTIEWLEEFLLRYPGTILFVTHDRSFLQKLATRLLELDRGDLKSWSCSYEKYLEQKEVDLQAEEARWHEFEKKLAQEEAWIRRGVKARRARNEGRVSALKKMREIRKARIAPVGTVKMQIQESEKSGQLVIKAENISYGYSSSTTPTIQNFSATLMRGDKIGIVGPNGSGKTTLLNLLLGKLEPQSGKVHQGTRLEIAYFDQLRDQLDDQKSVRENLAHGSDMVTFQGKTRHVVGYLQNFLFSPERTQCLVQILSGGERNRLLLAKLFALPSNMLILDEPTNDLDVETLELLEDLLMEYTGTVLLVSHDRTFLNNVVNSLFVFEKEGSFQEFVGSYEDWLRQKRESEALEKKRTSSKKNKSEPEKKEPSLKLTYQEKKELTKLPEKIEKLEAEQVALHEKMSDPQFYQQDKALIAKLTARLEELGTLLSDIYKRWEELEERNI